MADKTLKTHHREPFIHIAKRSEIPGWKAWLIRLAAIAIAFAGSLLIIRPGFRTPQIFAALIGVLGAVGAGA